MAKSDYESDELLDSEEDYELESEDEYEEYGQDEDDEEVIPKRRGRPLIEEAVVQDVGKRRRAAPRTYREPTEDELPYSEDLDESADGSSASTDLARMTERQRAKYMEAADEDSERQASSELLELTNERSKKKQFTEEELQLRRLENARKRKNFTMKRLEMEKQDTLNKLLLKRADKVRNLKNLEGKEYGDEEPAPAEAPRRPVLVHPALSRWECKMQEGGCVLDKRFFALVLRLGYDRLVVQYGKTAAGRELVAKLTSEYTVRDNVFTVNRLEVELLAFDPDFVRNYTAQSDLVISHGGTGSVLDTLRCNKKLVVLINTELADNHQLEIAEAFEQEGMLEYVRGGFSEFLEVVERVNCRQFERLAIPKGQVVERIIWS
ncbi:hypothetical protein KL930_004138 [Ogataea haglerorum]|uniref:UDP-N-acetylglucosamine transferase subunit ALG13 n=1 Tax=Ogataea haglerorum TaxID=1937702 RepID=A0AAN6D8Z3_9ASCO|nr:hypothetical protein KL915_004159 [Ogataea haglerorum]KAG7694335.1 hypothetical protein KL951_004213 [Ogataea haglerorum]KAG7712059.1 hypothetical protein KL914_000701 [Ogataea haglerorum]KAG7712831.1 hypothetical protein KL950_000702 [Ogataea haglerorum]KAG7722879.1 hypothetical protein KL913_000699 [Ogataea haglerorum]